MDPALFDFDGTITTGNTYTPFLQYASTATTRRRAWRQLLWPWQGYQFGLVCAVALRRRATAYVLAGRRLTDIRALGARYARDRLPSVPRPEAMARIAWHRRYRGRSRDARTGAPSGVSLARRAAAWHARASAGGMLRD